MPFSPTKAQRANLEQIAANITTASNVQPGTTQITGAQLISQHGILVDRSGQPIEPAKLYYLKPAPAINHLRRMLKAFAEGGMSEVEEYLKPYKKPEALQGSPAVFKPLPPIQPGEQLQHLSEPLVA